MRVLKLWLPVALWAGLILYASSDSLSSTSTEGWFERTFGFPLGFWPHVFVRKAGHIFEFGVLGILAFRASGTVGRAVAVAFLVAVADESRQALTVTRTGSPFDVIIDTAGAFLVTLLWQRLRQRSSE